ncbi:hypothetical protein VPNG_09560 [Cytospora leucostoma]|uniref:Exosome complex protein n=1 Tax=Cytospora leucostoma TaxID=1230097 RepID=A0A423VQD2_9PEZI|nr:hypothetical protein VPNG_09560 [Cytospora leucostoma]
MADVSDITPHLDNLDGDLDKLEEALKPLLTDLADVASKLPLLDKAKLYVLATYSLETALFSALRLNGTDAKEHPVFKELVRVRQYYEKIKKIETPVEERTQGVNTQAAIRFIKADLAGDNKEVDTKLKEQLAKERAKAALQARKNKKRPAEDSDSASAVAQLVAAESSKAASPAVGSEDGEVADSSEPPAKKSRAKGGKAQRAPKNKK